MSENRVNKLHYEDPQEFTIEIALEHIEYFLHGDYILSKRSIAVLLLQDDEEMMQLVKDKEKDCYEKIQKIIDATKKQYSQPLNYVVALQRQQLINEMLTSIISTKKTKDLPFREKLSVITMHPIFGIPILLGVLYIGLFKIVGKFGAGTLVDFLESVVFEQYINPFFVNVCTSFIPWPILQDLLIGEYGVLTLGVRYAIAIILPIVAIFFTVFSIIEDTGYLPRLAMLIDRIFKKIGLSGRAVIPMVLGFGCDTMATMVTRTLPTKRERVIATLLLALAVPCSAQIGVIFALLEARPMGILVWGFVIGLVFLFVGFLSAQFFPGEQPTFYMELPPLRLPKLKNIFVKTYTRVEWYLKEIIPVFIVASFGIWLAQITKLFDVGLKALEIPVKLIGLPVEACSVFLFGFFRRDYGAAGLYDLNKTGILTGVQLVVACVALTLFLPCIAQLIMNIKERGIKSGIGISCFVLFFSFAVAYFLNTVLVYLGVTL